MKNIITTKEPIETEVLTLTIPIDKLSEWGTLFKNNNYLCLDDILCWIEEEFDIECSPNHNTYFGDVDKDGGEVKFLADDDGSFWILRIKTKKENENG